MSLFDFEDTNAKQRAESIEVLHAANIARAVLHYRLDAGLNQGELAKLARTTQARVSEIEALKGDPKLSTLGRVASALGCMIDMVPIAAAASTMLVGYTATVRSTDYMVTAAGANPTMTRPESSTRFGQLLSRGARQANG